MITINKKDLDNVLNRIQCPAHYAMVFRELAEVYDYGVEFTWTDFVRPFINKAFTHQVPCTGVYMDRDVMYVDYLTPLFFATYFCKKETSGRVIYEVLGYILKAYGHFQYPESCREEWELVVDLPFGDFHNYWGNAFPKLTEDEIKQISKITKEFDDWKKYTDKSIGILT
jgi:hypothetical protein